MIEDHSYTYAPSLFSYWKISSLNTNTFCTICILRLFKNVLFILYTAHVLSCSWHVGNLFMLLGYRRSDIFINKVFQVAKLSEIFLLIKWQMRYLKCSIYIITLILITHGFNRKVLLFGNYQKWPRHCTMLLFGSLFVMCLFITCVKKSFVFKSRTSSYFCFSIYVIFIFCFLVVCVCVMHRWLIIFTIVC